MSPSRRTRWQRGGHPPGPDGLVELARRTKTLPPPPQVVWADLVERRQVGTRAWLDLDGDEVAPQVLEATAPSLVVWSSLWPDRPDDRVRLELVAQSAETALTVVGLTAGDPAGADRDERIRYRLSRILFDDLRQSYDN